MSGVNETFFTAVGCMDGRVQHVIAQYGKEKFAAKYPDTVTEAGIVGLLAKEKVDQALVDALQFKVAAVSIGKHHAKGIVVHGHAECAGNPVSDEQQKDDIRRSVTFVKQLVGPDVNVVGVFVHRSTSDYESWVAEEVPQTATA